MLYLKKFTNFFETMDLEKSILQKFENKDEDYDLTTESGKELLVCSMLLRHTLQLICNGHAVTGLRCENSANYDVQIEEQIRIATGIFPSVSMLNHSCDPNVITR